MQTPDESPSLTSRPIFRAALALALLAAIALVFVVVRQPSGNGGGETAGGPTGEATAQLPDAPGALTSEGPIVGRPAPDFALRNGNGELVKLSDLRGNVVFINFWATWCRPCREELPGIERVYQEKRAEGLDILAVNYQESAADASKFFADLGVTVPMLLDTNGSVYNQYRLQGLPDSFFVDREGNIAALHYGFLTEEKLRQRLEQAGLP